MPVPVLTGVDAETEAWQRKRVVEAALSWVGTPYRNCGYTKGPKGAVDCAMLLVGAFVEARVFEPFDPRPYPSDWMLHRSEEKYIAWLNTIGKEDPKADQPGDVIAYVFGRCYSHSGIVVDDRYVVHSYADDRICVRTLKDWLPLMRIKGGTPRPQMHFDMWARLRGPR